MYIFFGRIYEEIEILIEFRNVRFFKSSRTVMNRLFKGLKPRCDKVHSVAGYIVSLIYFSP